MKFIAREVLVFAVWVVLALPSGILYAMYLGKVLGRNMAWIGGATIIMVPVFVLSAGLALWLPAFLFARARRRARLVLQAPLLAAALTSLAAVVVAGPPGFAISSGPNPLIAWWVIALAAFAAYLHDRWSRVWLDAKNVRP